MNRRRRDFNPGMWANRRKAFMASPFYILSGKINARTAEGGTDDHEHRHSGRHFPAIEPQVKEDGESPETEMGKDVHHGIQNHAGCRLGRLMHGVSSIIR